MSSQLETLLRKKIAAGFKGKLLSGTLTRLVDTAAVDQYGDPVYTTSTYKVEGIVDEYSDAYRAQAGIPEGDSKVVLILGNCEIDPIKDDTVTLTGFPTMKIRRIKLDPAKASAECQSFEII